MELDQSDGHLDDVGEHLVDTDSDPEGANDLGDRTRDPTAVAGAVRQEGVRVLRGWTPMPGVFEREQLRVTLPPGLVLEDDVVVTARIERRVEVDKIDGRVGEVVLHDPEVVAVVEDIGLHGHRNRIGPPRPEAGWSGRPTD